MERIIQSTRVICVSQNMFRVIKEKIKRRAGCVSYVGEIGNKYEEDSHRHTRRRKNLKSHLENR
jgi:hypothetical protein